MWSRTGWERSAPGMQISANDSESIAHCRITGKLGAGWMRKNIVTRLSARSRSKLCPTLSREIARAWHDSLQGGGAGMAEVSGASRLTSRAGPPPSKQPSGQIVRHSSKALAEHLWSVILQYRQFAREHAREIVRAYQRRGDDSSR